MASNKIHIRKGKLSDKPIIESFTRDTFSWGDYLPGVWEQWVRSKRGELLVAEVSKIVVGALHVRYLEHREAWLEGVRVRKEFRQKGVASELIQAAHERAQAHNCRVIRLETGAHNSAGQRTFEKHGYRRLVEYAGWQTRAEQGSSENIRLAELGDAPACWNVWLKSWQFRASHRIVPADWGWRWWEFTRNRLRSAIRNDHVWVSPQTNTARAFLILRPEDSLEIQLLIGSRAAAQTLLDGARTIAANLNKENVYWIAPHLPQAQVRAESAGYTLDDTGLLIYQATLD